ncbi:hypothetical protein C8Q77DRAFT_1015195, partial [Trametes polyzona]
MSSMEILPTELILRILSFLPLQSLRSVRLTARRWNDFIAANESTVYHHAALLHNFVDDFQTLLPEAREAHHLQFLRDVPDWYQYCGQYILLAQTLPLSRKYFQLQKNWAGEGSAKTRTYGRHPYDVHRIKVDEKYRLIITTHEFGGLTVLHMDTGDILWKLNAGYVRRYAHCEYENGFLIFDRVGISKEVWRLEALYDTAEEPSLCRPDEAQEEAWQLASRQHASTAPHGHFRPWALIETPEFGRAYRFVYPDLLVSGLRKAYVWDVRTGQRVLELDNVQGDLPVGDINYVELSATHIFICSSSALRVFSRANGAMVLEIPSYQLTYSDTRLAIRIEPAIARHGLAPPNEPLTASFPVHVSRDGADIVAQLSDSRVLVIRDFMRIVRGEVSLKTAALEIGKSLPRRHGTDEDFAIYLGLEHGRAGIVTTSGVYIITLDPTRHGLVDPARAAASNAHRIPRAAIAAGLSFPDLRVACMPYYSDRSLLAKVTCLQMTESQLFFVWDAAHIP